MKKTLTLVFVFDGPNVLLGMKKRGFGAGRWNGFGGKVEEGEMIEDAARRELREEAGIEGGELRKAGILDFSFEGNPVPLEVHVFRTDSFTGEPVEGEEMRPSWYPSDALPFTEMWPDDPHWFPTFLDGKLFRGRYHFGEGDAILSQSLAIVADLA
jgi:8-oxo-dGTP diphosphatase/2-hydroxy-dATP diphosphatase